MLFNDDYVRRYGIKSKHTINFPNNKRITYTREFVYVLELSKRKEILGYYVGKTTNLKKRMNCYRSTFQKTTEVRKDEYMKHFKQLGDEYKFTLVDAYKTTDKEMGSYEWIMCYLYQRKGFRIYNSASMTIPQYVVRYTRDGGDIESNETYYSIYHNVDALWEEHRESIPEDNDSLFKLLINNKAIQININEHHYDPDYVIYETLICVPFVAKIFYNLTTEFDDIHPLLMALFDETLSQLGFDKNIESLVIDRDCDY